MNIAEFLGIFAVSQRVCQELLIKGPRYVSGHYWPQTGPGTRNFQLRKNGVFWGVFGSAPATQGFDTNSQEQGASRRKQGLATNLHKVSFQNQS